MAINTRENKQYEKLMAKNTHEVIRESPQRSQHAPSTAPANETDGIKHDLADVSLGKRV